MKSKICQEFEKRVNEFTHKHDEIGNKQAVFGAQAAAIHIASHSHFRLHCENEFFRGDRKREKKIED